MIGGHLAVTHDEKQYLPVIRRVRSPRWADELRVRLLYRQNPEAFASVAENLRHVFGAYRCTARELKPGSFGPSCPCCASVCAGQVAP